MRLQRVALQQAALLGLLLAAVSSCGPVYRTFTDYEAPADATARASLANCELIRVQCKQIEENKASECQRNSDAKFAACRAEVSECEQRADEDYRQCTARQSYCVRKFCPNVCISQPCSPNMERCEEQYDSCYVAAGGKVSKRTVCVERCENEKAASAEANDQARVQPAGNVPAVGSSDPAGGPPQGGAAAEDRKSKSKAQTDDVCLGSEQCSKFGRCSGGGSGCIAANNASCRQSLNCRLLKKCIAKGGECVKP